MAPPCRLILNFCWCHLILSFSLLALEGERGERRLKTWRQAVSVHHPPAACPLVFHLLLLGVAIIGPVMRLPKEEETCRSFSIPRISSHFFETDVELIRKDRKDDAGKGES